MKVSTGQIKVQNKLSLTTKEIEGEIVKIQLVNNKTSSNNIGTMLKISTTEGEVMVNKQVDNKDLIFYPLNFHAQQELLDLQAFAPINVNSQYFSPKYYVDGKLNVQILNAGKDGLIENIIIFYDCGNSTLLNSIQAIGQKIAEIDDKQESEKLRSRLLGVTNVVNNSQIGRN